MLHLVTIWSCEGGEYSLHKSNNFVRPNAKNNLTGSIKRLSAAMLPYSTDRKKGSLNWPKMVKKLGEGGQMTTIFQTFEHLVSWLRMVIFWPRMTMGKFQGVMVMVSDLDFHKTLVLPYR